MGIEEYKEECKKSIECQQIFKNIREDYGTQMIKDIEDGNFFEVLKHIHNNSKFYGVRPKNINDPKRSTTMWGSKISRLYFIVSMPEIDQEYKDEDSHKLEGAKADKLYEAMEKGINEGVNKAMPSVIGKCVRETIKYMGQ